jgi:hypothetical protein
MSNAQVNHGDHSTSRLVRNSELPEKASSIEEADLEHGDHLLHTTSGITTTVLPSFVEISATVKV